MKRKTTKYNFPAKYILLLLTFICSGFIILSFVNKDFANPVQTAVASVIIPIQDGMNDVGLWFSSKAENFQEISDVMAENKKLKEINAQLTEDNTTYLQQYSELQRLRELFELDDDYSKYNKIGARVIGKEPGNWFSVFTINKGSKDGIEVDMNVISGGGLVGIITKVGYNYSIVRSIIDDESSVSVQFASTEDLCFVNGDLKLLNDGVITVSDIKKDAEVKNGDMLLTSNISDKFLPGLLIGYVKDIENDPNNLTKSGYVTPVVDFSRMQEVLVITQLKSVKEEAKTKK